MADNKKLYGSYRNLMNFIRNAGMVGDNKTNNLFAAKRRILNSPRNKNLSDIDMSNIADTLEGVVNTLEKVDIGKQAYAAVSEVAKYYKGEKGKSDKDIIKKVNKMRDSLDVLFESLDVNVKTLEVDILKFYEKEGINPAKMSGNKITSTQLKKLNDIYKHHFKNLPAARTAFSNFISLLPNLRTGNIDLVKYNSWTSLQKGLNGFISNIVGSSYERVIYEVLGTMSKDVSFKSLESLKVALKGAENKKTDVLIKFMSPSVNGGKTVTKLAGLSVKSYDLKKKAGTVLHGTTAKSMRSWKGKGNVISNPIRSSTIAIWHAKKFLKIRKDTIFLNKDKYHKTFRKSSEDDRIREQKNLSQVFKNTLYYNADIFFGKDIAFLIGRDKYMNANDFIHRLLYTKDSLTAGVYGSGYNPTIKIKAYLAAEGGRING